MKGKEAQLNPTTITIASQSQEMLQCKSRNWSLAPDQRFNGRHMQQQYIPAETCQVVYAIHKSFSEALTQSVACTRSPGIWDGVCLWPVSPELGVLHIRNRSPSIGVELISLLVQQPPVRNDIDSALPCKGTALCCSNAPHGIYAVP